MGVISGGILGHAICTSIAVIGGKIVAQRISVRTGKLCSCLVFVEFHLIQFLHLITLLNIQSCENEYSHKGATTSKSGSSSFLLKCKRKFW